MSIFREIWKYPVKSADTFTLEMPAGAAILDVQCQHHEPHLWAMVDPKAAPERRYFAIVGTGHKFEHRGTMYVGTFQMHGGALVWHLFEIERSVALESGAAS